MSEYFKEYYAKNKDKILQKRKEKYHNDPEYRAKALERARIAREKRKIKRDFVGGGNGKFKYRSAEFDGVKCYTIGKLAEDIGKSVVTVNYWIRSNIMPDTPYKNERGERYYSDAMIDVVRKVLAEYRRFRQDKALEIFNKIKTKWGI